MNDSILNIDELSEYLKLSKSFLYKKVHRKTIPFVKVGRRTIFVREQIDKWIQSGAGTPGESLPQLPNL